MSVQRLVSEITGKVTYRARVKHLGREVATLTFDRKRDAEEWEDEQKRRLKLGTWFDPKRGRVPLSRVAPGWQESRAGLKRSTRSVDGTAWREHIEPTFGKVPVASITEADVKTWLGRMMKGAPKKKGISKASAARYLQALRSLLDYAIADGRIAINPAASVEPPTTPKRARREPVFLDLAEVEELARTCPVLRTNAGGKMVEGKPYRDGITVLGLQGMRFGELAGLQVRDRIDVPGQGLRLRRAVLSDNDTGELYVETLKTDQARTVPLLSQVVPIIDRWCEGKEPGDWIFGAPNGGSPTASSPAAGALSEANWKRSVRWSETIKAFGKPDLTVHDLRHSAASIWLADGADPKVVQRILGHASAAMTMDLYGHLFDQSLWDAAKRVGGRSGADSGAPEPEAEGPSEGKGS